MTSTKEPNEPAKTAHQQEQVGTLTIGLVLDHTTRLIIMWIQNVFSKPIGYKRNITNDYCTVSSGFTSHKISKNEIRTITILKIAIIFILNVVSILDLQYGEISLYALSHYLMIRGILLNWQTIAKSYLQWSGEWGR